MLSNLVRLFPGVTTGPGSCLSFQERKKCHGGFPNDTLKFSKYALYSSTNKPKRSVQKGPDRVRKTNNEATSGLDEDQMNDGASRFHLLWNVRKTFRIRFLPGPLFCVPNQTNCGQQRSCVRRTDLLTATRVADLAEISRSEVYELIRDGKTPSARIGRIVRVRFEDLAGFIVIMVCSTITMVSMIGFRHNCRLASRMASLQPLLA